MAAIVYLLKYVNGSPRTTSISGGVILNEVWLLRNELISIIYYPVNSIDHYNQARKLHIC